MQPHFRSFSKFGCFSFLLPYLDFAQFSEAAVDVGEAVTSGQNWHLLKIHNVMSQVTEVTVLFVLNRLDFGSIVMSFGVVQKSDSFCA